MSENNDSKRIILKHEKSMQYNEVFATNGVSYSAHSKDSLVRIDFYEDIERDPDYSFISANDEGGYSAEFLHLGEKPLDDKEDEEYDYFSRTIKCSIVMGKTAFVEMVKGFEKDVKKYYDKTESDEE